ncbi:hypothetical protein AB1Y20_008090 [Prymnesium parvum]|uniref:Peptide-O-fucosyltransferase 1 n=1 Tax=Prymnesium parvum TaxID=97485 RepID=A0AB34ISP9_PRYPA
MGAPLACTVEFRQGSLWMAGLSDVAWRMVLMGSFANAHGCAVIFPPPSMALIATHNDGKAVRKQVQWSHYFNFNASSWASVHVLLSLPEVRAHWADIRLVDDVPTKEQMEEFLARRQEGEPIIISIDFAATRSFWSDVAPALHAAMSPRAPMLPALPPSEELVAYARRGAAQLFGSCPHMGIHLRRGDRIQQYPDGCAGVGAVLGNVYRLRRQYEGQLGFALRCIFVMTDEHDTRYLDELRRGLEWGFAVVRFESELDLAAKLSDDNYFNFALSLQLCQMIPLPIKGSTCINYTPKLSPYLLCDIELWMVEPYSPLTPPTPLKPPPTLPPALPAVPSPSVASAPPRPPIQLPRSPPPADVSHPSSSRVASPVSAIALPMAGIACFSFLSACLLSRHCCHRVRLKQRSGRHVKLRSEPPAGPSTPHGSTSTCAASEAI